MGTNHGEPFRPVLPRFPRGEAIPLPNSDIVSACADMIVRAGKPSPSKPEVFSTRGEVDWLPARDQFSQKRSLQVLYDHPANRMGQSLVPCRDPWRFATLPAVHCAQVWTRDPTRMASEAERKTQQEIAQQATVAAAQKGSSSVPRRQRQAVALSDGLRWSGLILVNSWDYWLFFFGLFNAELFFS